MRGATWRLGGCLSVLSQLVTTVALAQPVKPPEPPPGAVPEPKRIDRWLAEQRDTAGRRCDLRTALSEGDRTVVACGSGGLWVVRTDAQGTFTLISTQDLGGDVVGLFQRDARIWAEISKLEARPVLPSGGASAAVLPDAPAATPEPEFVKPPPKKVEPHPIELEDDEDEPHANEREAALRREGQVVELGLGDVVIDLGSHDGVRHGDSIELNAVTSEAVGSERAKRRHLVAVGVVTAVSDGFSRVRLGINERVTLGSIATRVATKPTGKRVAPPRAAGLWEVEFMARPFLALGEFGGGMLLDASVGYRFEADLHAEVAFRPFGYGTSEGKPSVVPVTTFAKLSYDRELFEVGLGLGVQTVHVTGFGAEPGSGTLFSQGARIGARDGLHLDARSDVVLFHSRFEFAGFVGSGQIPVGQTSWLILEGGGGSAGYAYGEIGVRVLLMGNGDRGSVFFNGSVGGVGIFQEQELVCGSAEFTFPCWQTTSYAGPMLGAGAEWRF